VVFCRRVLDYQVRLKIPVAWYLATKFWMYYTWFLYFWPCILAIRMRIFASDLFGLIMLSFGA